MTSVSSTSLDDGIVEVVVDHPPVNALPVKGWFDFADAVLAAGRDEATRAVVVRAEGRGFNAGVEGAKFGVRVNAVSPSIAMHPFLAKVTTDELLAELTTREAFGRAAEPWEVANVMVFLASDYSSYLTGEVISASSQHP